MIFILLKAAHAANKCINKSNNLQPGQTVCMSSIRAAVRHSASPSWTVFITSAAELQKTVAPLEGLCLVSLAQRCSKVERPVQTHNVPDRLLLNFLPLFYLSSRTNWFISVFQSNAMLILTGIRIRCSC